MQYCDALARRNEPGFQKPYVGMGRPAVGRELFGSSRGSFGGQWRVVALVFDVVLLAPTWANAYFIRAYCLQDLHRLAETKKAIAQAVDFFSKRATREQDPSVSFTGSVGFLYNFLKRPVCAN
jgi:hypothetical protein